VLPECAPGAGPRAVPVSASGACCSPVLWGPGSARDRASQLLPKGAQISGKLRSKVLRKEGRNMRAPEKKEGMFRCTLRDAAATSFGV